MSATGGGSLLTLASAARVSRDGDDLVLDDGTANAVRLRSPEPALRCLVAALASGGRTADDLCAAVAKEAPGADVARLYFHIDALATRGLLRHTVSSGDRVIATLEGPASELRTEAPAPAGAYRLSRFALMRCRDGEPVLETALGPTLVRLHDARAAAAVALLAASCDAAALARALDVDLAGALDFVRLLAMARLAFRCDAAGRIAEEETPAMRQWEFHDLLFHARSRMGRHAARYGATVRFSGALPPAPAVKPPMSDRRIALHTPDMGARDRDDLAFSRVLEARRSLRDPGGAALGAGSLGEFLYRVARVKSLAPAGDGDGAYESSLRPCPSGGAAHEIELYLTIARCAGIEPGLYHYAPDAHALEHLCAIGGPQQALLEAARASSGAQHCPDVLITLAARFQRVSWKYESMAYALMLKNAGVLYQQMYLVATALGLAPCALGGGDSELFAAASGLDYYGEGSIGEFMLSGGGTEA